MTQKTTSTIQDILLTSIAPVAWGTTYIVASTFLPHDRPMLIAFLRALPAGIVLFLLSPKLPPSKKWALRAFILGGLNIGLFFAGVFITAIRLPGGVAACLLAIQPILVIILAKFFLDEKSSWRAIYAAIIGAIGVMVVVVGPKAQLDTIGVLTGLGCYTLMASGNVLARKWGRPVSLTVFTSWQLISGGILLVPFIYFFEGGPKLDFTPIQWGVLAYLGFFNTLIAYLFWFRGIEKLHSKANYLLLLGPVVALILGYIFLDQTISWLQFMGVVLVLLGIFLGQKK